MKQEETLREISVNFAREVAVILRRDLLICHKVLRHGAGGLSSPMKDVMLRIFISLVSP